MKNLILSLVTVFFLGLTSSFITNSTSEPTTFSKEICDVGIDFESLTDQSVSIEFIQLDNIYFENSLFADQKIDLNNFHDLIDEKQEAEIISHLPISHEDNLLCFKSHDPVNFLNQKSKVVLIFKHNLFNYPCEGLKSNTTGQSLA